MNSARTRSIARQGSAATPACRLVTAVCMSVIALSVLSPGWSAEALVLHQGSSTLQTYDVLKRVAVIDAAIADVVVSSLHELIIIGKAPGQTKVYVWDRAGRHELAVVVTPPRSASDVARKLSTLLDRSLRVKALDDKTVMVEGQLHSQADVSRAEKIIKAQTDGVQVVDLVALEDSNLTPAERRAKALEKLLGPNYKYILWDNDTVVVDGEAATPEEAERVRKLVEAGAKDFKAQSLVTYPGERPDVQVVSANLAKALGPTYKVWTLGRNQIVVEGTASDADNLKRTRGLVQAFGKNGVEIVDLTAAPSEAKVRIEDRVAVLQTAIGKQLKVRSLEDRAIVVEGTVASTEEAANVRKILAAVGPQIPIIDTITVVAPAKRQVVVRVRVAEVDKTVLRKYGLEWGQLSSGAFAGQPILYDSHIQQFYERAFTAEALQDDTHTRILAEPNLVVNDGEVAHLLAGGEIPVPVPQTGGGGFNTITIEYKQYGAILDITPKILPGGDKVELKVKAENSTLDTSNAIIVSGFQVPALRSRSVETVLTLNSGQAFFMGGMVSNDQSRFIRKIPILGDLPIIGQLFRHEQFQTGKTDLIILVTPEVMK